MPSCIPSPTLIINTPHIAFCCMMIVRVGSALEEVAASALLKLNRYMVMASALLTGVLYARMVY